MYPVLIVREEIICLAILLFILLYSNFYKMGKDEGSFLRICTFAIGHVAFDLITVLTVNHPDMVPGEVNRLFHIIFYMFALLFAREFFCYTVSLCCSKALERKVRRISLVPLAVYLAALPLLPMVYLHGQGTDYSFGPAAFAGYGVAMLFFIISVVLVLRFQSKLSRYVVGALLPMLIAAVAAQVVQIIVPELLFTGGAVTILTVGFFFSLENPVAVLRQKVQIDAMTGVKSRHGYEMDIVKMDRQFASGARFGIVFCDMNDLKAVNDTRGHLEGDAYIACVAQILMNHLKSAEAIYRMGGDEFLAVYQEKGIDAIPKEMAAVDAACLEQSGQHGYPVSLAMGCAVSDGSYRNLRDVLRAADYRMYSSKASIKHQRAYLMDHSGKLNISGLTDRIFDAFASTDADRFLFVCNMTTNVTRWSRPAVEYFGLNSEFLYDCTSVWMKRIHPDDRDMFFDDISAVFSGRQKSHDLQYRIKNASGNYVTGSCTATILRGRNGDPDLFAGTLLIHGVEESIDHLTELRNGYEMMNCFTSLIRSHTPAALLKLSILNLNRINMLYGYLSGNEIIRQFAAVIRNIVGASGSVFRSDSTKFVICMPRADKAAITEVYRRIRLAAEQRIHLDSLTPPLQLAAGGCLLPEHFDGTSSVLRSNLIFAHAQSKYEERGRLIFYGQPSALDDSERQNHLLLRIHQDAIAGQKGFYLLYQPIVSVATGRIVGAEALLRWSGEGFGTVSPERFIPWLEGDPCFFGLGNWILRTALSDTRQFLASNPDFVINVNTAMPQLEHESFRNSVLSLLQEMDFPPDRLCLELTERYRELNMDYLKGEVEFFRSQGIRIALDDLGTGFSSFGLLLNLDVDELKLDRNFVGKIQTQRVNQVLTSLLINASSAMGCSICLEGVEDQALVHYLDGCGATYYQGYYCAKPLRIEEFARQLEHWNASAPAPRAENPEWRSAR